MAHDSVLLFWSEICHLIGLKKKKFEIFRENRLNIDIRIEKK